MKKKKQYIKTISTRLDKETGELVDHTKVVSYNIRSDDNFVKLYWDSLYLIVPLSRLSVQVALVLAHKMTYENSASISRDLKLFLSRMLKVSGYSIDKSLSELKKKHIIFRVERGRYILNPYLFGKGSAENNSVVRESLSWKPVK